jgi:hypothetical protein
MDADERKTEEEHKAVVAQHICDSFDYLDWCRDQEDIITFEDTHKRENILRWGLERHRAGLPFDGLHIVLCSG